MITSLVVAIELALVGLLCLLAVRVLSLTRSQPLLQSSCGNPLVSMAHPQGASAPAPAELFQPVPNRPKRNHKADLITQLHILLSLQERDARDNGLMLITAPKAVKAYTIAWFYGASCALCEPSDRHSDTLVDMTAHLVARKLDISETLAQQLLAKLASCSTRLACFRNGLEGAEYWLEHRYVPREYSLYTAITSYAFI